MAEVLSFIAAILNDTHDIILKTLDILGVRLSDKDLHFWVIGILGIILFFVTDSVFKQVARWNVSVISFVYTFTLLVVFVVSLEIQQKITGRGNMEFADIAAGLWGFLKIFAVYLAARIVIWSVKRLR